jgi:hypothetical protein
VLKVRSIPAHYSWAVVAFWDLLNWLVEGIANIAKCNFTKENTVVSSGIVILIVDVEITVTLSKWECICKVNAISKYRSCKPWRVRRFNL